MFVKNVKPNASDDDDDDEGDDDDDEESDDMDGHPSKKQKIQ